MSSKLICEVLTSCCAARPRTSSSSSPYGEYGFLSEIPPTGEMAHFAIRGLMHEAALKENLDPDKLSFIHSVRVLRRRLPQFVAISP